MIVECCMNWTLTWNRHVYLHLEVCLNRSALLFGFVWNQIQVCIANGIYLNIEIISGLIACTVLCGGDVRNAWSFTLYQPLNGFRFCGSYLCTFPMQSHVCSIDRLIALSTIDMSICLYGYGSEVCDMDLQGVLRGTWVQLHAHSQQYNESFLALTSVNVFLRKSSNVDCMHLFFSSICIWMPMIYYCTHLIWLSKLLMDSVCVLAWEDGKEYLLNT